MTSISTSSTDSTTPATDNSTAAGTAANKRYGKKVPRNQAQSSQDAQADADGPGFDMAAEPQVPEHLVFPKDVHAPVPPDRNAIHEALHHTAKLGLPPSAPKHELLRASVQAAHRNAAFNGHGPSFAFGADYLHGDSASDSAAAVDVASSSVQAQQNRPVYASSPVPAAGVQDTLAERIYIQQVGLDDDGEKQAKAASQSKSAASAFRNGV